jgi:hypothetical protein
MVVAFGYLFKDMHIHRTSNGTVQQIIRVPLTYAPKNKLLLRADVDPDTTKLDAITLPRMAFEMMPGMQYDEDRRLPPLEKWVVKDDTNPNKVKRQYIPVPYNINFNLYIYVNQVEDANKIMEQILPFFTPDWTVSINIFSELNLSFDIPIIIGTPTLEDKYDGQFKDRRVMIWTIPFVMKTYYLGPVKSKSIIKFAHTRFFFGDANDVGNTDIQSSILVQPGLDANGNPTSNAAASIDANLINIDDDFGYIETYTSGPVGFE